VAFPSGNMPTDKNGVYPPGTPPFISSRRMNHSDLTESQYEAAVAAVLAD
jgi:hypothetical protein